MFYSKIYISDHTDIRSEVENIYKNNFFQNSQQDILRIKIHGNIMHKSFTERIWIIEMKLTGETANLYLKCSIFIGSIFKYFCKRFHP